MAERGLTMVLHSVVIGVALYALMLLVLKQSQAVAEPQHLHCGRGADLHDCVWARTARSRESATLDY
jgi:hypothetical protein